MSNIIDYVKWRGDLSFVQNPFNDVDGLILAYLSYVDLEQIAGVDTEEGRLISEVQKEYAELLEAGLTRVELPYMKPLPDLFREMANSKRFGDIRIRNYVNHITEEKNMQFSVMTLDLSDKTRYIAYRGTDATIVGWKEDFFLSNGVVAAHKEAVAYLNHAGESYPEGIRVGGHSKGGNLAVYSALECEPEIQNKIISVFDLDGPGFTETILLKNTGKPIIDRIRRIVPEFSVVGMLLLHICQPIIVHSTDKVILQHNAFSWQVLGKEFETVPDIQEAAKVLNAAIDEWITCMDIEQREKMIEDLFQVLEATGCRSMTEISEGGVKNWKIILKKANELEPETKSMLNSLLSLVSEDWRRYRQGEAKEKILAIKEKFEIKEKG